MYFVKGVLGRGLMVFLVAACIAAGAWTQDASAETKAPETDAARATVEDEGCGNGLPAQALHASLALGIARLGEDFALGLQFTSPFIFDTAAIKVRADVAFRNGIVEGGDSAAWLPYGVFRAGFLGVGAVMAPGVRLYGEGGALLVVTHSDFSTEVLHFGGYGFFGFEFLMGTPEKSGLSAYYIELGSHGTGAKADKMAGQPLYLNGFAIQTGFRLYL